MWGRDWATLSGGEAQRMALAIAVGIGKAEIVRTAPSRALRGSFETDLFLYILGIPCFAFTVWRFLAFVALEQSDLRRRTH